MPPVDREPAAATPERVLSAGVHRPGRRPSRGTPPVRGMDQSGEFPEQTDRLRTLRGDQQPVSYICSSVTAQSPITNTFDRWRSSHEDGHLQLASATDQGNPSHVQYLNDTIRRLEREKRQILQMAEEDVLRMRRVVDQVRCDMLEMERKQQETEQRMLETTLCRLGQSPEGAAFPYVTSPVCLSRGMGAMSAATPIGYSNGRTVVGLQLAGRTLWQSQRVSCSRCVHVWMQQAAAATTAQLRRDMQQLQQQLAAQHQNPAEDSNPLEDDDSQLRAAKERLELEQREHAALMNNYKEEMEKIHGSSP